jgi:hypothetical protein
MNRWLLIRRLRGPAFILLVGILAMLQEWTDFGFNRSWPLFLILAGILALAERAALAQGNMDNFDPITGQPRNPVPPGYGTGFTPAGTEIPPAAPPSANDTERGSF